MSPPDNGKRAPRHRSHLPAEPQEEVGNKRDWAAEPEPDVGNAALAWYLEGHGTVLRYLHILAFL